MIDITPEIKLPENEIQMDFVRASGPGGQNVNKVATAVHLRFDVKGSPSLPAGVRVRLMRLAGSRITREGVLHIIARRFRTQERNRQDALQRLVELIRRATQKPKPRFKTKTPKAVKKRILAAKRHRSKLKNLRRKVQRTDE